jgi:carboxymethylenebutenolidase
VCFELDSVPPIPVIAGAAISHTDLVLDAPDGNRFRAFAAAPDEPSTAGIVVLPDVRGLYRFYEELALRFAERGYEAVAIDYFGRSAGLEKREEDFEWRDHVRAVTPEEIQADVGTGVAYLRGRGCSSIFTVGFCMGGRHSWLAAAAGHGLAGAIGFYGVPRSRPGRPGPAELAPRMTAPILALQAGRDHDISPEDNAAFEAALTAAGVGHELVVYEGSPHSFFDRTFEKHAAASADAWDRVLAFIERNA